MSNHSIISAAQGIRALQTRIDTIANNIANLNTAGYKRKDTVFGELLYQQLTNQPDGETAGANGRLTPEMIRRGQGVMVAGTPTTFTPGQRQDTGIPTDVMIEGKGFFRVVRDDNGNGQLNDEQIRYTRNGSFQRSPNPVNGLDYLVTATGEFVLDELNRPIELNPGSDFQIHADGTIVEILPDGSEMRHEGRLAVYNVQNLQSLRSVGDGLWVYDGGAGATDPLLLNNRPDAFRLVQGAIETSNVDLNQEMTSLIEAQRTMQMVSRALQTSDQMLGMANELIRR